VRDARRRGDVYPPLDWNPEVCHPLGSGEAVIPDALLPYRLGSHNGSRGAMLRAFVEVDRATMGPERLAAKIHAYDRLHRYVPVTVVRPQASAYEVPTKDWRRRSPVFPRLLFVLDGTGPAGIANRVHAVRANAELTGADFRATVPILAAPLTDLLREGPSASVWRPVTAPASGAFGRRHWAADRAGPRRQAWSVCSVHPGARRVCGRPLTLPSRCREQLRRRSSACGPPGTGVLHARGTPPVQPGSCFACMNQ
jgi:hypothetical protein